ncbi:histidine kinase [Cytophagaceae bacterium YF14B1]|uniref:Histidine kinase n=1 Tax=Xanthocytophaga flava TaxID=3048013 RepID=A0AAE3U8M9_9BACT|nr:histidine kinase [Xanthocytophaga flavus]MDJ1481353.1 histidine kinase [Xanthocytophaga flavus]
MLYSIQKWEDWMYGLARASIYTFFYILAVYTQSNWLLTVYFRKGVYTRYIIVSLLILILLVTLRMFTEYWVLYLNLTYHQFYGFNLSHWAFVFVTQLLASLFGILLRIAMNYTWLLQTQEKIRTQQLMAEMNLLKSQVQPHFLFNTLNNIYYLAHSKSEKTTVMIAKLSDMMRYFLEEAPKEKVPLSIEVEFIKDYIELEKIRIPYPVQIELCLDGLKEEVLVSPMLLMPLVENVFKHGIDKTQSKSWAKMKLHTETSYVRFEVTNSLWPQSSNTKGLGLKNLKKRLEMIYNGNHILTIQSDIGQFTAILQIPLQDAS